MTVSAVELAGLVFRVRHELREDANAQNLIRSLSELKRALLVFAVDVDNAGRICEAARHPRSFVSLDGADHPLTRPADARYVATVRAAWASRYLGPPGSA